MNRGLVLALLLLAFVVVLVGADTVFIQESIKENESLLTALDPKEPSSLAEVAPIRRAYEEARVLFSVSVPLSLLNEYEEALSALEAAAISGEGGNYAAARAEAITALAQIKRSASFSIGQIF